MSVLRRENTTWKGMATCYVAFVVGVDWAMGTAKQQEAKQEWVMSHESCAPVRARKTSTMARALAVEEAPPAQARWVTPQKISRQDAGPCGRHAPTAQAEPRHHSHKGISADQALGHQDSSWWNGDNTVTSPELPGNNVQCPFRSLTCTLKAQYDVACHAKTAY